MFTTKSAVLSRYINRIVTDMGTTLGAAFNPLLPEVIRGIFRNGEQGFFYDPLDLKTQYQDATGTTAVNATGQPLGLVLDKSNGLASSSELKQIALAKMTGTAPVATFNTVTGVGTVNRVDIANQSFILFNGTVGSKWYKVSVTNNSAGVIQLRDATTAAVGATLAIIQPNKTFSGYVYVNSGSMLGIAASSGECGFTVNSIKELHGNHAYQSTSAARPIFRQKPILGSELVTDRLISGRPATGATQYYNMTGKMSQLSAGKTYSISYTVKDYTGTGNVGLAGAAPAGVVQRSHTTNGVYSSIQTPNAEGYFVFYTSGSNTANFSDISVKEVLGYRTDQNYIEYDGIDDKLITNLPSALTNCTVLRAIPNVGTQVKYNQTLPMLYEDSTNHAGLLAINRALTYKEQLRVMQELDKRAGAVGYDTTLFKMFDPTQQGFYYDPNDLSTMFQDSAGTIPVTAVGHPVGLIRDKSGRNNHAYQSVSACRPLLGRHPTSGARNLTTHSNNPNDGSWVFINGVRTANQLDSKGGYTAVRFQGPSSSNTNKQAKTLKGGVHTYTVCLKAGPQHSAPTNILLRNSTTATNFQNGLINLATGEISGAGWSSRPKPNGFWECTFTQSTGISAGDLLLCYFGATDVTSATFDIIVDYMQIESGEVSTPFQETISLLDITEEGVPSTYYLKFDGVDDFLQTNNIDFTATDKVSLFAGVRKLSDVGYQVIVELSSNTDTLGMAFKLSTEPNGSTYFVARGTSPSFIGRVDNSPATLTFAAKASFSPSRISLNVNGKTLSPKTDSMGSGNFGNYPLYIGRRAGTSMPFNGNIYGIIGIGKLTSDSETTIIEKELATRTGVTLNV